MKRPIYNQRFLGVLPRLRDLLGCPKARTAGRQGLPGSRLLAPSMPSCCFQSLGNSCPSLSLSLSRYICTKFKTLKYPYTICMCIHLCMYSFIASLIVSPYSGYSHVGTLETNYMN